MKYRDRLLRAAIRLVDQNRPHWPGVSIVGDLEYLETVDVVLRHYWPVNERIEALEARTEAAEATIARCKALTAEWRKTSAGEDHAWRFGADERYRWRSLMLTDCASELEAALSASSTPDTTQTTTKI